MNNLLKLEKYDEVKKAILQGKKNGLTIAKAVTFENNLNQKIHYVGRRRAAAPATGIANRHNINQNLI